MIPAHGVGEGPLCSAGFTVQEPEIKKKSMRVRVIAVDILLISNYTPT